MRHGSLLPSVIPSIPGDVGLPITFPGLFLGYKVQGGLPTFNPGLPLGVLKTEAALDVTDGTTDVPNVSKIKFTSGGTVSNAGGGEADVAISGGGGGSSITKTTKSFYQRTVLWDKTLSSAGTFDTNNSDDFGHSGALDQTYDHVEIIIHFRDTVSGSGSGVNIRVTLNNDTTDGNYTRSQWYDNGSFNTNLNQNDRVLLYAVGSDAAANTFSQGYLLFENYAGAHLKNGYGYSFAHQGIPFITRGYTWNNTAGITRFAVDDNSSGTFAIGTRLQVIGMKAETVVTDVSGAGTVQATQNATATDSSTSETSIVGAVTGSMTPSTGGLNAVGRTGRLMLRGNMSSLGITPGNITVKFKIGSTAILSSGAVALVAGLTTANWELNIFWTCQSIGSSASVWAWGEFAITTALAKTVEPLNSVSQPATTDLTGSPLVDATITFSASGNSITSGIGILEILN